MAVDKNKEDPAALADRGSGPSAWPIIGPILSGLVGALLASVIALVLNSRSSVHDDISKLRQDLQGTRDTVIQLKAMDHVLIRDLNYKLERDFESLCAEYDANKHRCTMSDGRTLIYRPLDDPWIPK